MIWIQVWFQTFKGSNIGVVVEPEYFGPMTADLVPKKEIAKMANLKQITWCSSHVIT